MPVFTKSELYKYLVSVLTTLLEVHPTSIAESTLYLMFDMNMEKYTAFRQVTIDNDFMVYSGNRASLSGKGLELAKELQAELDKAKQAKSE
jgi:hypothetical protein